METKKEERKGDGERKLETAGTEGYCRHRNTLSVRSMVLNMTRTEDQHEQMSSMISCHNNHD